MEAAVMQGTPAVLARKRIINHPVAVVPEKRDATVSGAPDRSGEKNIPHLLDKGIKQFFLDAVRVTLPRPAWLIQASRLLWNQQHAAKIRGSWRAQGVEVPPMAIVSVTRSCNLKCKGCYAQALDRKEKKDLSPDRLSSIMSEAAGLGVGTVLVAGGEPLTVPGLFDITKKYPALTFALFTNGTIVDDGIAQTLVAQRHVVPVLSMEGDSCATDRRRGEGMAAKLDNAMALLKRKGLFFGASITVTRENITQILDESYIKGLYDKGCRLFFFVEYVPVAADTESLALTQVERDELNARTAKLRKKTGALFIAFPGDEELFGGCLAAGRGFVHINAAGDLEPCPFAPYSDRSLAEGSLKSALRSPLLQKIRQNHANLKETSGGCALWTEREWVETLVRAGE